MATPFASAMKQFFGLKEGQTVVDFARELKDLKYSDKMEFHKMLTNTGKFPDGIVEPKQELIQG